MRHMFSRHYLRGDQAQLIMESLRQRCEQLVKSATVRKGNISTYLRLSGISLMAGDAYLIKEALQLTDNSGDLRGQVIRVHGCRQL